MIDPIPHEIFGKEHREFSGFDPRQSFFEHLKSPVFPLGRGRRGEQGLCCMYEALRSLERAYNVPTIHDYSEEVAKGAL